MTTRIWSGLAAAGLLATQLALMGAALQNKVLIIGVDGTRPAALAGASTPTINFLKSTGAFSDRVVTHPVTHSGPCWTSMFTGVWGDKHGVNDPGNSFTGNRLDLYPCFMKRLETINSNLSTVAYTRWADLQNALAGTDVIQNFASDDAITTATCNLLTNGNPDVLYTILLDVDSAGHSPGWYTATYTNAISAADVRIGKMINALTNRVTYAQEDWLVIVLTDHGIHDDPDFELSRITFHLVWGPSAARGTILPSPSIVDICATVLTHMGVPIDPIWNLDARVEGKPLPPTSYGTNLIFNGDAEWNSGTNNFTTNRGIAWWFDVSSTSLGGYGANGAFPGFGSPGPTDRGRNFFLGGTTNGLITQRINISDIAADVDDPGVDYQLSGWFGGVGSQEDTAALSARFLNGAGVSIGSNFVGNVTAADRTNMTGLLERRATGTLPAGTRFVEFALTNRMVTGPYNDGSADNLSFVLSARPDPDFYVLPPARAAAGWQVGAAVTRTDRLYKLRRTIDFRSWDDAGAEIPGNGGTLLLSDTNPPPGSAFYRVESRRP